MVQKPWKTRGGYREGGKTDALNLKGKFQIHPIASSWSADQCAQKTCCTKRVATQPPSLSAALVPMGYLWFRCSDKKRLKSAALQRLKVAEIFQTTRDFELFQKPLPVPNFHPPPPFMRTPHGVPPRRSAPLCDIPSGCCSFTGPWTVTRSSLRMLRRVAVFCRPLRPVLLRVSFPRSRSPAVGVPGLC